MMETIDPKTVRRPAVRCARCDDEVVYYNRFVGPDNSETDICWECLARAERGFFAKRNFSRRGRRGDIPR